MIAGRRWPTSPDRAAAMLDIAPPIAYYLLRVLILFPSTRVGQPDRAHTAGGERVEHRRQRTAVPRRGRCADGPADAPPLDAGLPVRGGRRARRRAGARAAARRRPGRVSRHRRAARRARRALSAPPRVARARPQRGMRACAASITAGRSTSTGNVLEMPSEPRRAPFWPEGEAQGLSLPRGRRLRLGLDGRRPTRCATSSRRRGRRRRASRISIVKMHVGCNWAQVLEGAIDSAHSSSLHSTDMLPARVDGASATERRVAAAVDRQGAAPAGAAHRLRLPLRRDPPADQRRRHARLRAHHALRRAVHRADPAEQPLQPVDPEHPARRHAHDVLLHRVERAGEGIEQEAWRKFCGAQVGVDLDANFRRIRTLATTTTCRTARR